MVILYLKINNNKKIIKLIYNKYLLMDKLFDYIIDNKSNNKIIDYINKNPKLDLYKINDNGISIIFLLINKNNIELIKFLIEEKKYDINKDINLYSSYFYYTITFNYNKLSLYLIDKIDLNQTDKNKLYPIHYAIYYKNDIIFDKILLKIKDITNIYDTLHNNLLLYSIKNNYIYGINKLMSYNFNINEVNNENMNIIMILSKFNTTSNNEMNKYIKQYLQNEQLNLNCYNNINYQTFIFFLIENNNIEIIKSKEFKQNINKIDINAQELTGNTIFNYVINYPDSLQCIYYLIDNFPQCDINKYNNNYQTPLFELLLRYYKHNLDPIFLDYIDKLINKTNLNILSSNLNYSCMDLLIYTNLWDKYIEILKHKKLIISNLSYKHLINNYEDINKFIELLIENHIYFIKKYDNKEIYKKYKLTKEKDYKKILLEEFKKDKNILLLPVSKNNIITYDLSTIEEMSTNLFDKYFNIICSMKFLESLGVNCLYDTNNFTNNILTDKFTIFFKTYKSTLLFNNDIIEELLTSSSRFTVINLQIELRLYAHTNFLIFDKKTNTLERYDPHGYLYYNQNNYKDLDEKLNEICIKNYIKYDYNNSLTNIQIVGIQKVNDIVYSKYCLLYCVLYVMFKINNPVNKDKLNKKIVKYLGQYPNTLYQLSYYILSKTKDIIFKKYKIPEYKYYSSDLTEDEYKQIYSYLFNLEFKNDLKKIKI